MIVIKDRYRGAKNEPQFLIGMTIRHQYNIYLSFIFHTQINVSCKKMSFINHVDFLSIHVNVCHATVFDQKSGHLKKLLINVLPFLAGLLINRGSSE